MEIMTISRFVKSFNRELERASYEMFLRGIDRFDFAIRETNKLVHISFMSFDAHYKRGLVTKDDHAAQVSEFREIMRINKKIFSYSRLFSKKEVKL